MAIKHKVIINVTDDNGNNLKVLCGGDLTLAKKILNFYLVIIDKFSYYTKKSQYNFLTLNK